MIVEVPPVIILRDVTISPLFRGIGLFVPLALVLSAQPAQPSGTQFEDGPLHPITIMASYDGQILPVIGASGKRADVLVRDKRQKLKKGTAYTFVRAPGFAPGSVRFIVQGKQQTIVSYRDIESGVNLGYAGTDNTYRLELTTARDYEDCFLAVLFFDPRFIREQIDEPRATVVFQELGKMKGGRVREVVVDLVGISFYDMVRLAAIPILFSRGQEVHSNYSDFTAAYFRRLEMVQHRELLAAYRTKNAGQDHALVPYLRFAPVRLNVEPSPSAIPDGVVVRLDISAEGFVEHADLTGAEGDSASREWLRALKDWLFLPVLRAGTPTASTVVVPLKDLANSVH